jgi:hypothetical protein
MRRRGASPPRGHIVGHTLGNRAVAPGSLADPLMWRRVDFGFLTTGAGVKRVQATVVVLRRFKHPDRESRAGRRSRELAQQGWLMRKHAEPA